MFCKNCGSVIADGAAFCANCGAPAVVEAPEAPVAAEPVYAPQQPYEAPQYVQPAYNAAPAADPVERSLASSTLVFGILSISFAFIPYVNFLGIIFGAIALSKAKRYVASGYVLSGKTKTGKILGIIGLISAIICTVFWLIIIIGTIVSIASYNTNYSSYYYY